jgi:hypothetical protein
MPERAIKLIVEFYSAFVAAVTIFSIAVIAADWSVWNDPRRFGILQERADVIAILSALAAFVCGIVLSVAVAAAGVKAHQSVSRRMLVAGIILIANIFLTPAIQVA